MFLSRKLLVSTALVAPFMAVAGVSAPAFAQNAPSPAAVVESGGGNDIVVTARRREESIQDVPVAIVAFGQQ